MSNVCITDLPTVDVLETPPGTGDILLVHDTSTRFVTCCTVDVLLKSIPVKILLEHVYQRLKERRRQ